MSECYSLICDDCKVTLWCGQGRNREGDVHFYLYRTLDDFDPTAKFLIDHEGHTLGFRGAENDVPGFFEGYRALDGDDREQRPIPLDDEQRQHTLDDPTLRHPRD